jgi:hypothetical protein
MKQERLSREVKYVNGARKAREGEKGICAKERRADQCKTTSHAKKIKETVPH